MIPETLIRTNLHPNPFAGNGAAGWTVGGRSGVTKSAETVGGPTVGGITRTFCRFSIGTTNTTAATIYSHGDGTDMAPVVAGTTYTFTLLARASKAGVTSRLRVVWSAGADSTSALIELPTSWQPITITATAPTGATTGRLCLGVTGTTLAAGDVVEASAGYISTDAGTPFDGATPNTLTTSTRWTGTAFASSSEEYRPARFRPEQDLIDMVRVELDSADLANMVANHSGQISGTTGWTPEASITLAAVANPTRTGPGGVTQTLAGAFTGGRAIRVTSANVKPYPGDGTIDGYRGVLSPSFAIAPGQNVRAQVSVADSRVLQADRSLVVQWEFWYYNSSGQRIKDDAGVHALGGGSTYRIRQPDTPWTMFARTSDNSGPGIAPVGAVSCRVKISAFDQPGTDPYEGYGSSTAIAAARAVYLSKLMVVVSDTDPGFVPFGTEVWQNVIASSISANIARGGDVSGVLDEIEAGTCTAVLRDVMLDPGWNKKVRPGRKMRVSATPDQGVTWTPLFTGRISNVGVRYDGLKGSKDTRPTVTLTGSDAVAEARGIPSPYAYSGTLGQKIRALMADASAIPYATDSGSASTTKTSLKEDATLWDQICLAANSFVNAKAWVDPSGVLQAKTLAVSSAAVTMADRFALTLRNQILNPSFEDPSQPIPQATEQGGASTWTIGYSTGWAATGTRSALVTSTASGGGRWWQAPVSLVAGNYHSGTITVRAVRAVNLLLTVEQWVTTDPYLVWQQASLAAGQTYTFNFADIVSPKSTAATFLLQSSVPQAGEVDGPYYYIDRACFYSSPFKTGPAQYFDGTGGSWSGTPNNSESTLAVPYSNCASYREIEAGYGTKSVVNKLNLTRVNNDETDGEKVYGPYVNQSSINTWSTVSADLEVVDGVPDSLAADYLAKFATPGVFADSISFDALHADAWAIQAGFKDLYTGVRTILTDARLDKVALIIGIEHEITPSGWGVTWRFRPADLSESVSIVNQSGPGRGPADVIAPPAGPIGNRSGSNQSIGNAAWTTVALGTSAALAGGVSWDATNNQFTVPRAGRWLIAGNVNFRTSRTSGSDAGRRLVRVVSNTTTILVQSEAASLGAAASNHSVGVTSVVQLAAGDVLQMQAYQNSGAAISTGGDASSFALTFLGD